MTDMVDETAVSASVVVARVPVVDTYRAIVGFELVVRSTSDAGAQEQIASQAVVTSSSLLGTVDVNLSVIVGDKLLYATVDRTAIMNDTMLTLPPRKTVLQVPSEDVNSAYLARVREYTREGFSIMVEHTAWRPGTYELLAMANLVKIDVKSGTPGEVMDVVESYAKAPVDLVAVNCDTEAELAWARAVGFDFFMGRAVQAREFTSEASAIAPMPLSQMQLGLELLGRDLDLNHVEDILKGDPALVVQLLNMASSGAGGGLRRQVRSLREALVFMGTVRLRQWAALVVLSRHTQHHSDALMTALVRARMCELLAASRGINPSYAFTAGLLSGMELLMGIPASEIEEQVNVDEELANAAFRRQGAEGKLIDRVEEHERWLVGSQVPPDHDEVTLVGAQAFAWATSYVDAMEQAGRGEQPQ